MSKRKKYRKMGAGRLILGIAAGFAAGAIVGMLFAPKKGATLRRRISQTTGHYAGNVKERFSDFMDSIVSRFQKNGEEYTMAEPGETNDQG